MPTDQSSQPAGPDFVHSEFFVMRTPLLPFDELRRWSAGLEANAKLNDAELENALAHDRASLRARLNLILEKPEIREAVFVACPDLANYFDVWRHNPESKRGRSVERTLVRYFARMTSRATPFGLFAGPCVGRIGEKTRLVIEGQTHCKRHTRLDMDYLFAVVETLKLSPELKPGFRYYPNSSLYRAAGRVHYVEARLERKVRSYHLVKVDENKYLIATLEHARTGESSTALAGALVDEEITPEEAASYIEKLIENQILVPDLALSVTGREPLDELIKYLERQVGASEVTETLREVQAELAVVDRAGLGNEPERYRAIAERLRHIPTSIEPEQSFQSGQLFQVDLFKEAPEATLGSEVIGEVTRGLEIFHRLSGPSTRPTLARFRDAFAARYEDREVPLVEALDDELGLSFNPSSGPGDDVSPLLTGLAFPFRQNQLSSWTSVETLLLSKLTEALRTGATEINIDESDLKELDDNPNPLPDALGVTAVIAAASAAALDQGEFRVLLDNLDGPAGACLLGRFCHADDALQEGVKRHLHAEEALQPDAVFAELVHLPDGRTGNVICRPVMRDYEIPYLGSSGAAPDKQIPITDLRLRVDANRGNRLCLRSASLDCEVIPRLTTAHNYNWRNVPVYTFLCALQEQNVTAGTVLRWEKLKNSPYLPRVVSGRLILSLARWRLNQVELAQLCEPRGAAAFKGVQQWRAARGLPRWVALADGDQLLPVDFDNILSLESFLHLVKRRSEVTLREIFPEPDQLCLRGPEGLFVHEIVLPLVRTKTAQPPGARKLVNANQRVQQPRMCRSFPPGSEWIYAKIYAGPATIDHVLREAVRPVIDQVLSSAAADRWFFVRYGDPDWHLRLRFHGPPERLHSELQPALNAALAPLLERGQVWRVQYDTYEREVERYGGPAGIELAERLFQVDSEAALQLVELIERGDEGLAERWKLTFCGIDDLLDSLGFDLSARKTLMTKVRSDFAGEFKVDKQLIAQMGAKFRVEREELASLLDKRRAPESPLFAGLEVLRCRSAKLIEIGTALRECTHRRELSQTLENLAASYIHMHANRLLRSAHRAQELVIYDYLARMYHSKLAQLSLHARDNQPAQVSV